MTAFIHFYKMRCITNLHVGSGDTNYGVIDSLIERDVTTGFPCVHSTGMKGAIKQKFEYLDPNMLIDVFGSDVSGNKLIKEIDRAKKENGPSQDKTQQGKSQFLSARLLAMPIRSDRTPFFLATSPKLIADFLAFWNDLSGSPYHSASILKKVDGFILKASQFDKADLGQTGKKVESLISDQDFLQSIQGILGNDHPVVILSDDLMLEITNDLNLPVIARNALEDGQSKNLWYEQVLPRESILYFPIIWDQDRSGSFNLERGILQVGGNASVGYGITKITPIS